MKHCLILDKQPYHAQILGKLCADIGFNVLGASSLAEARNAISGKEVPIAFIEMNGIEDGAGSMLLEDGTLKDVFSIFMTEQDSPRLANEVILKGASYVFCKPFNANWITPILQDIVVKRTPVMLSIARDQSGAVDQFGYLRGSSEEMQKLYCTLQKVSRTDASLMIVGETGTGKDLVAQTVHALSCRSDGPFIAFNSAAIAENLAESELFGHEKGSFSGAYARHYGFFEKANGGTIFFDEITEMDISLQAKLLRALETRKIRRIGAEQEISIDVRVISASNRSPEQAVRDGKLREDLYYRLAQFPLCVPPLRLRGGDIAGLAQYFLSSLNEKHKTEIRFSAEVLNNLRIRDWPGNVRELKHYIERAYILSETKIDASVISCQLPTLRPESALETDADMMLIPIGTSLVEMERKLIEATLERNGGDKRLTAVELGVCLKTLYNRLRVYRESTENLDCIGAARSENAKLNGATLRVVS